MINFWAVLVSAIVAMIIGSIWWGPLFGKMWMHENGFNQLSHEEREKMKRGMGGAYLQQFILSFIQGWVIAYVLNRVSLMGTGDALMIALVLWLGFILPIHYGNKVWGNKKMHFIVVTLAGSLITMLVMTWILAIWR